MQTPTTGCRRYGCHVNPRTGHCNRCGQELADPRPRTCGECGCELTENEVGRCAVCFRDSQA